MNVNEWLRLIAGTVVLVSLALGFWVNPLFFLLTAFVGLNLAQSAFTRWCPMMILLRWLGVPDGPASAAGFPSTSARGPA
jgi:hypothetical protein